MENFIIKTNKTMMKVRDVVSDFVLVQSVLNKYCAIL